MDALKQHGLGVQNVDSTEFTSQSIRASAKQGKLKAKSFITERRARIDPGMQPPPGRNSTWAELSPAEWQHMLGLAEDLGIGSRNHASDRDNDSASAVNDDEDRGDHLINTF